MESVSRQVVQHLQDAAREGDVGAIRAALAAGAEPDSVTRRGEASALILATEHGHLLAAQYLAQSGANLDYPTNRGYTALMKAVRERHVLIVEFLLDAGADPNFRHWCGSTALIECAHIQEPEGVAMAQRLIDAGADLELRNIPDGYRTDWPTGSPLQHACYAVNEPVGRLLLENGAPPYDAHGNVNLLEMLFSPRKKPWCSPRLAAQAQAGAEDLALALLEAGTLGTRKAESFARQAGCLDAARAMSRARRKSKSE